MIDFKCQLAAKQTLAQAANRDHHSLLIEGVEGCGKTYLAKQYAKMLTDTVDDFMLIPPNVQSIRESIEACMVLSHKVLLCIENLDLGQLPAAYALLKILEEPSKNVYIVITCRNIKHIPDTIISRSQCSVISPPVSADLITYGESIDKLQCSAMQKSLLWRCMRSFKDVDTLFSMTLEQQEYILRFPELLKYDTPISTIQWNLSHYSDNSELPVEIGLRVILNTTRFANCKLAALQCLKEFEMRRVAKTTALAKFVLECKYGDGKG